MQLTVTQEAAKELRDILSRRGGSYVRVSDFQACGCGRIGYSMDLEDEPAAEDQVIQVEGFRFVVDPASQTYLEGATIGYKDDLVQGGFTIDSPNAPAGCGCGGHS
jgi:iron-sulfur cluster assembly protein